MAIETSTGERPCEAPLQDRAEILAWLIEKVAQELWVEAVQIDVLKPFRAYGMDSISAAVLMGEIAERMQLDVSPTLFEEYPTLDSMTTYLTERARQAPSTETSV